MKTVRQVTILDIIEKNEIEISSKNECVIIYSSKKERRNLLSELLSTHHQHFLATIFMYQIKHVISPFIKTKTFQRRNLL